jgi:hypothetical protein
MTDREALAALHCIWAGVFFGLGIFLLIRGDRMATVKRAFCWTRFADDAHPDQWEARVQRAIERRQIAEGAPARLGVWMGAGSLALSALTLLTNIPVGLLYALLCLVIVAVGASAFLQLRNTQQRRVAVLASRTPDQVIPPYWFLLAALSACSILPFASRSQWTLATVLVCISSLVTAFIAWRLTMLGAILTGDDVPAEQYVDERVRTYRCSTVMVLALIQPFVFATQAVDQFEQVAWIAAIVSGIVLIGFVRIYLRSQRRSVRLT